MNTDKIKQQLTVPSPKIGFTEEDLLSTGSTLLNLALSGNPKGGFCKGRYFFFVGDSDSGKTFLGLSCLAEASINPSFDNYRLIHDDVEGGALMDFEKYFGTRAANRIEPPAGTRDNPTYSETVEDFYYHLDDAFEEGEPFIYLLDSQDALGSKYSQKKFEERKTADRSGKEARGDYGDGKAKIHSGRLRQVCSDLRRTGSILIILNQTRDNIDGGLFSSPTVYSGGRALRFYATAQIWSSTKGKLKKSVRNKERQIGILVKIAVKKNRLTGKEWTVEVPIYYSVGVDDIGSCVDYLVSEGHWKKKGGRIAAPEFEGVKGFRDDVIRQIEKSNLEEKLRSVVGDVWAEVESKCVVDRKPRYE